MGTLSQDLRFACRMLAKSPGFTLVAVVTLALGIGVNTAIFSLVNAVVFRPLPFENPDRLVEVYRGEERIGSIFSYLDYIEYRDRSRIFEELACFSYAPISTGRGDRTELRTGQIVTGNYFAALGVQAIHGRLLTADDDKTPGAHPVAVLGHRLWQQEYGASPELIGQTITLNGHPYTVVGVAPEGFFGALPVFNPDVWVPMMMQGQIEPGTDMLANRNTTWLRTIGRLKPDVSLAQAQANLDLVAAQLPEVDPHRYEGERASLARPSGVGLPPEARPMALGLSALVMSMVGLILLAACANVANLLLARSAVRRGEIAIRLALGASRWRLVRQLLTESMLLAVIGGAAGSAMAMWGLDIVGALRPQLPYNISLALDFGLDGRVFLFAALLSVLTGLVFGAVPALQATNANVVPALKDDTGASTLGLRRSRLRSTLVVGQVAVSLILLIGSGLFIRSLLNARSIDPGFDHENVLGVSLAFSLHDYDDASGRAFYRGLLERVRVLPGVESASVDKCVPLGFAVQTREYWVEGRPPMVGPDGSEQAENVNTSVVGTDNFKTLGIPLLRGRDFTDLDTQDSPRVTIVNQAFADRVWPDQDPLGRRISLEGTEGPFLEVVGVVRTIKYVFIGEDPRPFLYLPFEQNYDPDVNLLVRTEGDPMALSGPVQDVIRGLDPDVAPSDTRVLSDWIGYALLPARFAGLLFGAFGALALLLASVGLYGVMSYTVEQRMREIGIRVALGAERPDVLRLVLRQGLMLTLVGLGIGLIIALAGTRVVAMLLYDISATDLTTFAGVSTLLVAVALLACYVPARRATKVDPMAVLRHE